jgi:hypothetical protein
MPSLRFYLSPAFHGTIVNIDTFFSCLVLCLLEVRDIGQFPDIVIYGEVADP